MAELTFKSPGVSTREIDLSGPSRVGPTGTPAGVIGTSAKGRAFVPLVFANLSEFVAEFGAVGPDKFGPMALREWFSNARAGLYLKVLGVGDGKARLGVAGSDSRGVPLPAGAVKNAGFVVGEELVNPDTGRVGINPKAGVNRVAQKATATLTFLDDTHGNYDAGVITLIDSAGNEQALTIDENGATGVVLVNPAAASATINLAEGGDPANKEAVASRVAEAINASTRISITASASSNVITLTQDVPGVAGNTIIVKTIADTDMTLSSPNADTEGMFTGGEEAHMSAGRTHFLSVLMKEAPTAAATVTFSKADDAGAPASGDSVKITAADGTSSTYVFVHATNSNSFADDPDAAPGHALENGDVLAVGDILNTSPTITLTVGDSRVGGIAVELGTADATYVNLKTQIAAVQTKITKTDVDDDSFTLTQKAKGRTGNTKVVIATQAGGDSIAGHTFPNFSGGKGEQIFTEAGAGLADATGNKYANVLRGVLMYPSGVVPSLNASRSSITNNVPVGKVGIKPTAKAVLNFKNVLTEGAHITLKTTGGANRAFIAQDSDKGGGLGVLEFSKGQNNAGNTAPATAAGAAARAATSFATVVNAHADFNDEMHAHASGSYVTLTYTDAGAAANRAIASNLANSVADIPTAFRGGSDSTQQFAAHSAAFTDNPSIKGVENGGSPLGKVDITSGKQEFIMILNGHKSTVSNPSAVTASFDPQSSNYFPKVFNTDPEAMQTAGHYLYTYYDVFSTYATPTATGNPYLTTAGKAASDIAMLLPSKGAANTGTATQANTECFADRFRSAVSPTFISQKFGGINQPLFRAHSLDDGAGGNDVYKVSIENLRRSQSDKNRYGTFDLLVRGFDDNDREPIVLERFSSLSLDPNSERFISRIIGDQRLFYDFDKRAGSQKLTLSGKFANNSNYIRIEVAADVEKGVTDPTALPFGFRGPQKLNVDNASAFAAFSAGGANDASAILLDSAHAWRNMVTPPLPLRRNIAVGETPKKRTVSALNWGVQFETDDYDVEPNKNSDTVTSAKSWTKYFPDFDQDDLSLVSHRTGSAAADTYNNNKFTLENIQVLTSSATTPDAAEWAAAQYRRNGVLDMSILDSNGNDGSGRTRFLNAQGDMDLGSVRRYLKFNCFVAGGFDGVDIFDKEKSALSDVAIMREVDDSSKQGGKSGATAATYMKAIDVLAERSDVDIQLLAIPGIRQALVTDRAIDAVEERFDAMYIMDAIVYDTENTVITGSAQMASVSNTVTRFNNRVLDTSFAATYFPDVILNDPASGQNIQVPPSVPVLGAFALNDQLAHPWFAPAGFSRGAMANVAETQVKLNRDNLDSLYDVDINPLTSFPHTEGVVVFGQKTLLRTQSSLDRVNVRRLLIELRRRVRRVANSFIFEPNREATLARFSAQVSPILRQIQQQQGVDRFLVKIDTTTTTQTDVENNTLRGKIFLQPTRSVEFISLDFVITNAGAEI